MSIENRMKSLLEASASKASAPNTSDDEYRFFAKKQYADGSGGDVEIHNDAKVERLRSFEGAQEDGAYVEARVWVERPKKKKA